MIVRDLLEHDEFELAAGDEGLEQEMRCVYVCDLLSWVMGRAGEGCAWITIQGHVNIVAVANLVAASCIVVAEDAELDEATIRKANGEGIPLLKTKLSSYDVAKKFMSWGL